MPRNEWRAFRCALFAALDAAFPFENGPTVETVLRELGKNCFEVYLAVAGRAESSGAIDPGWKAAVHALAAAGAELGVLHVKHFYAVVIEIDEFEIVELVQDEMAWIEQDVAAGMILQPLQKHFEGDAVVQIFAGVNFEANVHAGFVERVENWLPTRGEFVECGFDQSSGALRPGIKIGPRERARKRDVRFHAEICGSFCSEHQLFDGPCLAGSGISVNAGRGETVECRVVCGMDGDELALQMGGEFRGDETVLGEDTADGVTILFAFGCAFQIEEASVPRRNLHAFV